MDQARGVLERHPEPRWQDDAHTYIEPDWVFSAMLLEYERNRQREPAWDYEVQAFRIGDLALVALMGCAKATLDVQRKLGEEESRRSGPGMCRTSLLVHCGIPKPG